MILYITGIPKKIHAFISFDIFLCVKALQDINGILKRYQKNGYLQGNKNIINNCSRENLHDTVEGKKIFIKFDNFFDFLYKLLLCINFRL